MAQTYRDLQKFLRKIPKNRLDDNVTVYDAGYDEYYPVNTISLTDATTDVLDPDHVVLIIKED